ncbi:MAG: ABC transporter ATP-binding protein [Eubacteriaceae bacterium]|nr:ABC transporter ATP-binding protein [Eubacteriaceae bacterium]
MIEIKNLNKTYKRDGKIALKNIELEIKEGEFTALLGQNGAGKTTLINILSGNVKKTSGKVFIGGFDLDTNELDTKKIIGIVPQEAGFDTFFPLYEVLKKQSGYFGIKDNEEHIDYLLDTLSLTEKKNSMLRELSGGMKRRVLIAKALVHKPKILILDEPTAGVDIEMRHSIYDFLNELHDSGMTIILTTHYIEEAERLCDRILVINKGEIIADEPKEQLMEKFSKELQVTIYFEKEIKLEDCSFLMDYRPEVHHKNELHLTIKKDEINTAIQMIAQKNMHFADITIEREKLEDIYLSLISNR